MDFPVEGLTPKGPSGVAELLARSPTFDGRGCVVAIFDTGVDVAAEGLRFTPNGQPKFIDAIDATGSGDVDMTCCVTPNDKNEIIGLTGRVLKLNPAWSNPTKKYYIGIKKLQDISPGQVVKAYTAERKERYDFEVEQYKNDLEAQIRKCEDDEEEDEKDELKKLQKTALQLRLDAFKKYIATTEDIGPVFDSIVWQNADGEWVAVLDKAESGDFTAAQNNVVLRDFALKQEFDTWSFATQFTYTVKIYVPDVNNIVLSIVVASGTHGSHVAGITGAYYGENHPQNSAAPGVQMITVKIGDSLITTMETQSGLIRAFLESVYKRCDIVNISYGEQTLTPNAGAIQEYAGKVAKEYGVFVISSAGNEGPCLTTCGSPGATVEHVISVAAVLEPPMMEALYGMKQTNFPNPTNYHWSSRGPSKDGAMLSISGLGAAQVSVPRYVSSKTQLMNGTSMSSPAVSSLYAALLSAIKQLKHKYTLQSVRHAVEQSATWLPHTTPFSQGHGLMHVANALKYFEEIQQDEAFDVFYQQRVTDVTSKFVTRGVYIRQPNANTTHRFIWNIAPQFLTMQYEQEQKKRAPQLEHDVRQDLQQQDNNVNYQQSPIEPLCNIKRFNQDQRIAYQRALNFKICDANKQEIPFAQCDFIEVAQHVTMTTLGKDIPLMVHVDKIAQKYGSGAHFFSLQAYIPHNEPTIKDVYPKSINKVLFTLPITVLVPELNDLEKHNQAAAQNTVTPSPCNYTIPALTITPHEPQSVWLQVPEKATFATVTIEALDDLEVERGLWFSTNCVQAIREDVRDFKILALSSTRTTPLVLGTAVAPNTLMEMTLTHPWNCPGQTTRVKVSVAFGGIAVNSCVGPNSVVALSPTTAVLPVDITSLALSLDQYEPQVELTKGQMSIFPKKCTYYHIAQNKIHTTDPSSRFTSLDNTQDPIHQIVTNNDYYSREILFAEGTMYGVVLEYAFVVKEKIKGSFTLKAVSDNLYESPYYSQNTYIYDKKNKLFHVQDAFPDRREKTYDAGSYTAQVFVKHTSLEMLKALEKVTAVFYGELAKPLTLPVYAKLQQVFTKSSPGNKLKGGSLYPRHTLSGYVNIAQFTAEHISGKDLPWDTLSGHFLFYKEKQPKYLYGLKNTEVAPLAELYISPNITTADVKKLSVVNHCDEKDKKNYKDAFLPNNMKSFLEDKKGDLKNTLGVYDYLYKEDKSKTVKTAGAEEKKEDEATEEKKEEDKQATTTTTTTSAQQFNPLSIFNPLPESSGATTPSEDDVAMFDLLYPSTEQQVKNILAMIQKDTKLAVPTLLAYYNQQLKPTALRLWAQFIAKQDDETNTKRFIAFYRFALEFFALLLQVAIVAKKQELQQIVSFVQKEIAAVFGKAIAEDRIPLQLGLLKLAKPDNHTALPLDLPSTLSDSSNPPSPTASTTGECKENKKKKDAEQKQFKQNVEYSNAILALVGQLHVVQLLAAYGDYQAALTTKDASAGPKYIALLTYINTHHQSFHPFSVAETAKKAAKPAGEKKDASATEVCVSKSLLSLFDIVARTVNNKAFVGIEDNTAALEAKLVTLVDAIVNIPHHPAKADKKEEYLVSAVLAIFNFILADILADIKALAINLVKDQEDVVKQIKVITFAQNDTQDELKKKLNKILALTFAWTNITRYRVDDVRAAVLNRYQPFF